MSILLVYADNALWTFYFATLKYSNHLGKE